MKKTEPKVDKKDVIVFDPEWAAKNMNVGMGGVDPADIRPPQILLIQKSSEQSDFTNQEGTHPTIGQFFHTGKNTIFDEFDCYFVWASKGKYIDRKKAEKPEREQYQAIGLMGDDLSMFGYRFRSSALYGLSPLFTAVVAQKKPMFCLRCHVEAKSLTGEKGTWYIPTLHVLGPETDEGKLAELHTAALQFDRQVKSVPDEEEESVNEPEKENEKSKEPDCPY